MFTLKDIARFHTLYSISFIQYELEKIRKSDECTIEDLEIYLELKKYLNKYEEFTFLQFPLCQGPILKMLDIFVEFLDFISIHTNPRNEDSLYRNFFKKYPGIALDILRKCNMFAIEYDDGGNEALKEACYHVMSIFNSIGINGKKI